MKKIGVFDSGIGGLTVLQALRSSCPGADMLYLGDVERMPYGLKDKNTILRYSRDCAHFLRQKGAEVLVIACNTATAAALSELQEEMDIPVYGVIPFAVEEAKKASKNGTIGVIATEATVKSGSYTRNLQGYKVYERPASPLVTLIEAGVEENDERAILACKEALGDLPACQIDTLVLGCTHFPVYERLIQSLLPHVALVDSGKAIAKALEKDFGGGQGGKSHYYSTKLSPAFSAMVHRLDPSAGEISLINWDN